MNKITKICFMLCLVATFAFIAFRFGERVFALTDEELLNPEFNAEFVASPGETLFPNPVSFTTKVFGVKAGETINFTFWLNCSSDSTDYGYLSRSDVCGDPSKDKSLGQRSVNIKGANSIPAQTYQRAGKYTAKILIEKKSQRVERRAAVTVKPVVDIKANGVFDKHADVPYGGSLELSWTTAGLSDKAKCISSWEGEKKLNDKQVIGNINDAKKTFTLTCSEADASNSDSVEAGAIPKVIIRLRDNLQRNAIDVISPFDSGNAVIWEAYGAEATPTPCTAHGSDPGWDGKLLAANGSFNITGLTSTTTYSVECRGYGGTNQASVTTKVNKGNCAFMGDNTINAAFFCENKLVVLSNANNINFTGSFVAKDFSIATIAKNIRFYYQAILDDKWPPGFRYLELPKTDEVKNN